jgi:hypothetical protein
LISTAPLLALAATTMTLTPKGVLADEQGAFKGMLTVQYTASQQCASGDGICTHCVQKSGFYVEAQGLADTSLGPLFAKVLKCASPTPPYGTYSGTLTLSTTPPSVLASPKDYLALAYSGKNDDGGDFYGFGPFSGTLTVTNGFGKFQGARGAVTFIATGGPSIPAAAPSPYSNTGIAFYSLQGTIDQGAQR